MCALKKSRDHAETIAVGSRSRAANEILDKFENARRRILTTPAGSVRLSISEKVKDTAKLRGSIIRNDVLADEEVTAAQCRPKYISLTSLN